MKLKTDDANRWIEAPKETFLGDLFLLVEEDKSDFNNCLEAFAEIDEPAAILLGQSKFEARKHGWIPLNLNGLSSLSAESAKGLGHFRNCLLLDGLTTMSPEIAHNLSSAFAVSLRGLRSIDLETATQLARCEDWLLIGLESPSDAVISALSSTNSILEFPCLEAISDAALECLVKRSQTHLRLSLKNKSLSG